MFPFGEQKIRSLCTFFSETSICKRHSEKTERMYFMIKNKNIFDKYLIIWDKVSNVIKQIIVKLHITKNI